jgi:hypothetical protein
MPLKMYRTRIHGPKREEMVPVPVPYRIYLVFMVFIDTNKVEVPVRGRFIKARIQIRIWSQTSESGSD